MPKVVLNVLLCFVLLDLAICDIYDDNIEFIVYNGDQSFTSTFNKSFSQQGCRVAGNFSVVIHGWHGSQSAWIPDLISNLSFYRGGCVIFMNYSYFSDRDNYFEVITHFKPISELVARKLRQLSFEGVRSDAMFMFGFSFGGRIVIEAAMLYGPKRISQIDSKEVAIVVGCLGSSHISYNEVFF